MSSNHARKLPRYAHSLAGTLLAAREAVMAPIRPLLRQANVTEQQWRVLRVLADEGALDAGGVANAALLYPPSVTRILMELADRGLIERTSDPADARRRMVAITDGGRDLVANTAIETLVLLRGYEDAFGKERLHNLLREAAALSAALRPFQPDD